MQVLSATTIPSLPSKKLAPCSWLKKHAYIVTTLHRFHIVITTPLLLPFLSVTMVIINPHSLTVKIENIVNTVAMAADNSMTVDKIMIVDEGIIDGSKINAPITMGILPRGPPGMLFTLLHGLLLIGN